MEERAIHILPTRSGTWFSRLIHLAPRTTIPTPRLGWMGPLDPFTALPENTNTLPSPPDWWRSRSPAAGGQYPAASMS